MQPDDIRYDLKQQRAELADTAAELRDVVHDRVASAKQAANPMEYARAYPLLAVGVALGAGLAFGMSGADAQVARGAVEGVKSAGEAIGDGASALKDKAVALVQHDDTPSVPESSEPAKPGIRDRIRGDVDQLLADGLRDLLGSLGQKTGRTTRV